MTTLDPKAAFFHVIDSHRWLAASGYAWNLVGPNAANETKEATEKLLPDVMVMARDCALSHARSLIKFYLNHKKSEKDIILKDFPFDVRIPKPLRHQLDKYENPIGVHLLHLTDLRDSQHRKTKGIVRPDWDKETTPLVESIHKALENVSQQKGSWPRAFKSLYEASTKRYQNKSYTWPCHLGNWDKVEPYLVGLGL